MPSRLLPVVMICLVVPMLSAGLAEARSKKKAPQVPEFYHEYQVVQGDTLYSIARKFGVSMDRVRKWNRKLIGKNDMIKVGSVLKIRASVPMRIKRTAYYIVKKGDTLRKIAKRTGSTVAELKKVNGLRRDLVKPGQKLAYLVAMPEKPSESVGRCSSGSLVEGEKMPPGPGYSYGSRPNVYGANETITLLLEGFGRFRKKHPEAPMIVVGNLSRKGGGKLDPHKSHQSGRDVDLGYMHKAKLQPVTHMLATDESNIDVKLTWALIRTFLDTKKVTAIFIDYRIQGILYEYLKKAKVSKRELTRLFQYPRGKGTAAVIKHVSGHHHHMHIRFTCPKKDQRCED